MKTSKPRVGLREQLERLFPMADVKRGGMWAAVQHAGVTIEIIEPGSVMRSYTVEVFCGRASRRLARVEGSGIEPCLSLARDHLSWRANAAPTKSERTRAMRAFRLLDSAFQRPCVGPCSCWRCTGNATGAGLVVCRLCEDRAAKNMEACAVDAGDRTAGL